jgi:hypothetical protein
MNRNFAFALVLATAAAGNAFADDITVEATPFVSSMSRAEVQADMRQASTSSVVWAQDHDQLAGFRSERSRADATAEYIAARDSVMAFNGEDSGSVRLARGDLPQPVTHLAAAE